MRYTWLPVPRLTVAVRTVDGGGTRTLTYEVAMKQYNLFDESDPTTGLRTLAVGDTVGFAVAVGSRYATYVAASPDNDFGATVSAGGQGGMFNNFNRIGLYQLAASTGDFDEDGDVDGFDFLEWQRGESPIPLSASDLADWEGNFGATGEGPLAALSAGASAIPEPSTAVLLSLALAALATSGRRRG